MNHTTSLLLILCAVLATSRAALTMDQLKQAAAMIRKVCQPKTGATTEAIEGVLEGIFPDDDRNLKCYMKCAMEMTQSMGKGKLRPDAAISQAKKMLPPEIRDRIIASINSCRSIEEEHAGLEACELAFVATQCVRAADPEAFIFP